MVNAVAALRATLGSALFLASQGCHGPSELIATSSDPFLYVVISPTPIPRGGSPPSDSAVYALLLTTGSSVRSEPRTAESFVMRRAGDGAVFPWSSTSVPSESLTAGHRGIAFYQGGNYVMAERSSATTAGRVDLKALDTLLLEISTLGVSIRGRTIVPEAPMLTLSDDGGRKVVWWPRARGAAGYMVGAGFSYVSTDTVVDVTPLPGFELDSAASLTIAALDTNVFLFVTDSARASAGLSGAFGLFGAVNSSTIKLLPDAARPRAHGTFDR